MDNIRFKSDGQIDYETSYFEMKTASIYIKVMFLISLITSVVTIFSIRDKFGLELYKQGSLTGFEFALEVVSYALSSIVFSFAVIFTLGYLLYQVVGHLITKYADNNFKERAFNYVNEMVTEPLCYRYDITYKVGETPLEGEAWSHLELDAGTKIAYPFGTDTVIGEITSRCAVFDQRFFDDLELLKSDILKDGSSF